MKTKRTTVIQRNYTRRTIEALFARSGNKCAFPNCKNVLVTEDDLFVGQICHIVGISEQSPRFEGIFEKSQLNSASNLMLLCYEHHRTVDVLLEKFTAPALRQIKSEHEKIYRPSHYEVSGRVIDQVIEEMQKYWIEVERVHTNEHPAPDLAIEINSKISFIELMQEIRTILDNFQRMLESMETKESKLESDVYLLLEKLGYDTKALKELPYYKNPLHNRNWEEYNLGVPNHTTKLRVYLMQMEIIYLETHIRAFGASIEITNRLFECKKTFLEYFKSAGYVD